MKRFWLLLDSPALGRWHYGKIIMLWIGAVAAGVVLYIVYSLIAVLILTIIPISETMETAAYSIAVAFMAVIVPSPLVAMVIVTWKWLSGRDR